MKHKYILIGYENERPYNLHMNEFDTLSVLRKVAKHRAYWVDKRIYKLYEEIK